MLLSTLANRYAHELLAARAGGKPVSPLSGERQISTEDAYEISRSVLQIRTAQGDTPVGRRIGFANRTLWPKATDGSASESPNLPFWGHVYDSTVRYAEENRGLQSLHGALRPRIEPNVIFKLGATPSENAGPEEMADCIEWMAHGLEIVDCPYTSWDFEITDAIAAFGLHAVLIVGEAKVLSSSTRSNLAEVMAQSTLSVSCSEGETFTLCGAGLGSDVLESPIHALVALHKLVNSQPRFKPLSAGEIIASGAWTASFPIKPKQTWSTAFSGISLPGLSVSLV